MILGYMKDNKEITDEMLVDNVIKFTFRYLKDRKIYGKYIDAFNVYKIYKEHRLNILDYNLKDYCCSRISGLVYLYDKVCFFENLISNSLYWKLTKDGWEYWNSVNSDFKEYYKKYFKL